MLSNLEVREIWNSTVFQTVLAGTLVASFGMIIKELLTFFVFERTNRFSTLRSEIADKLTFWADVYSNGPQVKDELKNHASADLRRCASRIVSFANDRYFWHFWLPSDKSLRETAAALIGLSNAGASFDPTFIKSSRATIEDNLRISLDTFYSDK